MTASPRLVDLGRRDQRDAVRGAEGVLQLHEPRVGAAGVAAGLRQLLGELVLERLGLLLLLGGRGLELLELGLLLLEVGRLRLQRRRPGLGAPRPGPRARPSGARGSRRSRPGCAASDASWRTCWRSDSGGREPAAAARPARRSVGGLAQQLLLLGPGRRDRPRAGAPPRLELGRDLGPDGRRRPRGGAAGEPRLGGLERPRAPREAGLARLALGLRRRGSAAQERLGALEAVAAAPARIAAISRLESARARPRRWRCCGPQRRRPARPRSAAWASRLACSDSSSACWAFSRRPAASSAACCCWPSFCSCSSWPGAALAWSSCCWTLGSVVAGVPMLDRDQEGPVVARPESRRDQVVGLPLLGVLRRRADVLLTELEREERHDQDGEQGEEAGDRDQRVPGDRAVPSAPSGRFPAPWALGAGTPAGRGSGCGARPGT